MVFPNLDQNLPQTSIFRGNWKKYRNYNRASPFKYNKKIEDKSWQDKKDNTKNQKEQNHKWNKINKDWKKLPDISGKIGSSGGWHKELKDSVEKLKISEAGDEYGKDFDNSLETYFNLQLGDPSLMKKLNNDPSKIASFFKSGIKWKTVDDGWKVLSKQGWKDPEISEALFKAIKERKEELSNAAPMNINDIWSKISDSWDKNFEKGNKEVEKQKTINDEWKNGMNILQSPKPSIKEFIKDDNSWQKLSEQGWKAKDIEESLIKAWKERENALQSPQNLFGKTADFLKNMLQKDKKYKSMYNSETPSNEPLQSSVKVEHFIEMILNVIKENQKDMEEKSSENTEDENDQSLQSPINLEDFIETLLEVIKEQKQDKNDKSSVKAENESVKSLQSHMTSADFMKMVLDGVKGNEKGWNNNILKEAVYKSWNERDKLLQSSTGYNNMKWKKINDGWKKISNKS